MEPRELWERHTVLARAFCQSDEEVRSAQTTLDDAQASRARSLAAFAVVVGNDKAVAEMLGLPEREVRIARRTVGREDARSLADDLLMPPPLQQPAGPGAHDETARAKEAGHPHTQAAAQSADHMPAHDQTQPQPQYPSQGQQQQQVPQAQPAQQMASQQQAQPHAQYQSQHQHQLQHQHQMQHHAAQSYYQHQEHYQQPQEHYQAYDHTQLPDHMGWSPVQDAVLVDGWQSGVDLEILALELGTDLRRLTARAQYLSAQGRLFVAPEETGRQGGKHRRETVPHSGIPTQQMSSPGDMLLPDGLVPDGYGGYWANWNEMLPAPQG
ncbi:hypothetical protein [Streptomyces winkii]|uniref:hypothetical protein n=1 Tax=Streptomyces winkii TaxID=3051178 RepID=UPI0028D255F5|nr:hypothetical protein [Streptomyces sp. DSM 40971]